MSVHPYKVVVGDVTSSQNDEIQDSISSLSVDLKTDLTSEIQITAVDRGFKMHDAGYFVIRRPVTYGDLSFEISNVEVSFGPNDVDIVEVVCRNAAVQRMKRDKGAAQFGNISPTSFAQQMAAKFGLQFFGSPSAAKGAIVRTLDENTAESTWDVLNRLAADNNFSVFETGGLLYFAKEEDILSRQTSFVLNVNGKEDDPFYMHDFQLQRSDDEPEGAELSASIARKNGVTIRPGMVLTIQGIKYFPQKMMVTSVEYQAPAVNDGLGDAIADPVTIEARTPEDPEDVQTAVETSSTTSDQLALRRGDRGERVRRLQTFLSDSSIPPGPIDGIFGPKTEEAVKTYQKRQALPITGVYDEATRGKVGI